MAKKLWGGRFKKKTDPEFFEFQKSITHDHKLAEYDVVHSLVHVVALRESQILTSNEYVKLTKALHDILDKVKNGKYIYNESSEDIHTDIQNKVEKNIGKLALKMHALRSRNDQVAFDEKFYCLKMALNIQSCLKGVCDALLDIVIKNGKISFIGYTHTQRAQKIDFINYCSAFVKMFVRDKRRLTDYCDGLIICIGAGALTGTSISIKAYNDAIEKIIEGNKDLKGKMEISRFPLDSVSDRDFVIELLSVLALVQMHLSRFAEDMILYSTKEYGLIDLPEEFCTGSSLMPHKKNPDFLELVRGNTGKIYGNLMSVLTMMKGLPLSYNRDMQLDKEPLMSSIEVVESELKIMARFIAKIKVNKEVVRRILAEDLSLYATEVAEWLVLNKKVPFKTAHDLVGKLVILLEEHGNKLDIVNEADLLAIHPDLKKSKLKEIMTPEYASKMKKTASNRLPRVKD